MAVFIDKLPSLLLPFVAGALYALCLPGNFITLPFPLGILGVAVFLVRPSFLRFALFSLGYCCLAQYWVAHALQEFGGISSPWNILLTGIYSLITLPQYFVFILAIKAFQKYSFPNSFQNPSRNNILSALALTFIEYHCPQQFPHHLGYHWLQVAPWLGLAPIGGVPLFSFISFWVASGMVHWYKTRKIDRWCLGVTTIFLAFNVLFPLNNPLKKPSKILHARLVQANIGNFIKANATTGDFLSLQEIEQQFFSLSTRPSSKPLDLLLWPETALPLVLDSDPTTPPPSVIKNTIAQTGASLATGTYNKASEETHSYFETRYNALFLYNTQSRLTDIYRKQKLIPFGETLPFGPLNRHLAPYIKNLSFFAKGKKYPLFRMENGLRFIGVICYEILFSDYLRTYLNKHSDPPHFLVNLANDSWYGNSSEPRQHQFLARWRALEFNLPIIRITNTGISSVLFPDGTESERIDFSQSGFLDVDVPVPDRSPTLFERSGTWVTWLLGLFLLGSTFLTHKPFLDKIMKA